MKCLLIKLNDGLIYDITDILSEYRFGGSTEQGCRTFELTVANNGIKFDVGDTISFKDTDIDYTGQIQISENANKQKTIDIEVVDYMSHWTRSYTTKIVNSTAESVATEFCNYMGMAIGQIASTGIATGERVYQNRSLYSIVKDLYCRAGEKNGKKYLIRTNGAYFNVYEKGEVIDYIIGDANNLSDVSMRDDMSQLVNKVVVFDDQHKKISEKTNKTLRKVGLYQKVADKDDNIDEILTDIEHTLVVSGPGDNSCQAGKYIRFFDSDTKLTGIYEITEDSHIVNTKGHRMNLRLSFVRIA